MSMDIINSVLKEKLTVGIQSLDESSASALASQTSLLSQLDSLMSALSLIKTKDLPSLSEYARKIQSIKQRVGNLSTTIHSIQDRASKMHSTLSQKVALLPPEAQASS
ncbi:hypothetical protein RCL1_005759 [Eukaryota sp. TZLM3-RCL]